MRPTLTPTLTIAALLCALAQAPASAQGIIDEWNDAKAPPPPPVAKVTLDPATTALLVLDIAEPTCNQQARPRCLAMLPRAQKLLALAREKHWTVIYTLGFGAKPDQILAPVAMQGNEPLFVASPDKFIATDLNRTLKQKNIKTVVTIGAASEGAILQTATTAAFRGYDVVVPLDATASATLYAEQYTAWDLVNAPRLADHVKLSAVDLID